MVTINKKAYLRAKQELSNSGFDTGYCDIVDFAIKQDAWF